MTNTAKAYWLGKLDEFKNANLIDTWMDEDGFIYLTFTLTNNKVKTLCLLSDEEANDSGRFQVLEG